MTLYEEIKQFEDELKAGQARVGELRDDTVEVRQIRATLASGVLIARAIVLLARTNLGNR